MSRVGTRVAPSRRVNALLPAGTGLGNLYMGGDPRYTPMPILEQPLPGALGGGRRFVFRQSAFVADFVATGLQTVFIIVDGKLLGRGNTANGRLGIGEDVSVTLNTFVEIEAPSPPPDPFDFVATGSDAQLALANGRLYVWGNNAEAKTGLGTTAASTLAPTQIGSFDDWVAVDIAFEHGGGVRANGELYMWGRNINGKTGRGLTTGITSNPTQIGTDTDWVDISVGDQFTVARKSNGTLWGWGSNLNGTGVAASTPTQIGSDDDWEVHRSGRLHTIAIKGGEVWTFGSNAGGRTARGLTAGIAAPDEVTMTGVTGTPLQVAAYSDHTALLTTEGIFSAGTDPGSVGRLAAGNVFTRNTFGPIAGLLDGEVPFSDVLLDRGRNNGHIAFVVPRKV